VILLNKKDLIIVALATFCLTATLLMALPIRSETPPGTYDAWVDSNEDGNINILDSIITGNHFMTSGDSTKNVSVANWPSSKSEYEVLHLNINITAGDAFGLAVEYCGGYSRLMISADPGFFTEGTYRFTLMIVGVEWGIDAAMHSATYEKASFVFVIDREGFGGHWTMPQPYCLETRGPYVRFWVEANSTLAGSWGTFGVNAYVRNE
jgi:hypothetical protein